MPPSLPEMSVPAGGEREDRLIDVRRAHHRPALSAVGRAMHAAAADVDRVGVGRRERQRERPGEARDRPARSRTIARRRPCFDRRAAGRVCSSRKAMATTSGSLGAMASRTRGTYTAPGSAYRVFSQRVRPERRDLLSGPLDAAVDRSVHADRALRARAVLHRDNAAGPPPRRAAPAASDRPRRPAETPLRGCASARPRPRSRGPPAARTPFETCGRCRPIGTGGWSRRSRRCCCRASRTVRIHEDRGPTTAGCTPCRR